MFIKSCHSVEVTDYNCLSGRMQCSMQSGRIEAHVCGIIRVVRPPRQIFLPRALTGGSRSPRISANRRIPNSRCSAASGSSSYSPDDTGPLQSASHECAAMEAVDQHRSSGRGIWWNLVAGTVLLGVAAVSWAVPAHARQRCVFHRYCSKHNGSLMAVFTV